MPHGPRPTILMYHRIANDAFDPWDLAVAPANFADQMGWLSANRQVLTLTEFALRHRHGSLAPDAVAVTFDDGYACAAETAAPILEAAGVPATIFLPIELIEKGHPFWWDELEAIVLGCDQNDLTLQGQAVRLGEKSAGDRQWAPYRPATTPRQAAFLELWRALRPKRPAELDSAMAELRRQSPPRPQALAGKLPLTPSQVRSLSKSLITFGAHGLTHPSLPALPASEKEAQIRISRAKCAALTGDMPDAFSYPHGDYDRHSMSLVEEAGFAFACASGNRCVTARSSRYALPRVACGNWNAAGLAKELATR